MQLKRKRSESELSTSTTSTFNSPLRSDPFSPSADVSMDIDTFHFTANLPVSPLSRPNNKPLQFPRVSGRTMKRFRDNRPSEHEVHERTLNILYTAQRQQPHALAREMRTVHQQQHDVPVAAQPGPSSASPCQQTDLHSFWNLPSRPSAPPVACLPPSGIDIPSECEDCGRRFGGEDDDSNSMVSIDMSSTEGTGCVACGKHVCPSCSITNLGEQRRCLSCAGTTRTGNSARNAVPWATGMSNWLC